jgi:hypothetical protein
MQPAMMLSPRSLRKALMDQHGVTASAIATAVPCSVGLVVRVLGDKNTYESAKSKRIKQLVSERVGVPVADLWPEAA